MSKSLKNFITIKDALKKNTGRQLRVSNFDTATLFFKSLTIIPRFLLLSLILTYLTIILTAPQIHFLCHSWHGGLDYSESGMSEAVTTEKYFNVSIKNA